ncbi:MAG: DNA polymerase I [Lactococcus chungangensis]|uniref:DNA polymerase I n=1 Tax=Pseudolactococcus chungangensis CAU 28 = DSM 22330 TaxID=1122154 RepID=A0A1K2HAH0_9LACT|nr:DNA polymerase I [Lactococcus chungangensis]MDD3016528.1 DNA polymerase I [Lactococcus chungangensis]PCS04792.1 DNA polymerase I [Lactococcus chungangensis CAU 28 = DSM 22330]SFZ73860.1 DNA polymerase I [Lactococcus chungangensis CAU 28 = DSM 22330]
MTTTEKKLLLIDGSSIAFRAFFALYTQIDRFVAPSGLHTNAIFAFHTMLRNVLDSVQPTHVLVAFDAGKTTFRTEMYADYKGGRAKTPNEFREQLPFIKEMLEAQGIKHYELANYEADDIIGTLATQAENGDFDAITVVSGDRDLTQLTTDKTTVEITIKGVAELETYTPAYLKEKLGLTTAQFIDLKALMGDKSDNIPGVTKIGEKTGIKLLLEYGSLEGIYDHVDGMKTSKMKENLINDREQAFLSKELATIDLDSPIEIQLDDAIFQGADYDRLKKFYQEMGFQKFLEDLEGVTEKVIEELDFTVVGAAVTPEMFHEEQFFYLEILGEDYQREPIIGFAWGDDKTIYVSKNVDLLKDFHFPKNTFDFKKNKVLLGRHGIDYPLVTFDTMLAKYLYSTIENNKISTIADLFGLNLPDDDVVYGKGAKRAVPFDDVLYDHLARKVDVLVKTKAVLLDKLRENDQEKLLSDMELPLANVLAKMEMAGIKVSGGVLSEIGLENERVIADLTAEIYELAGETFNINSPKQLGVILFEKMQLPVIKKTKTGYSTAVDVLEQLAPQAPIVDKILKYRQISKIQSTYVTGLLGEIMADGKIHTRYIQDLTQTGRLSSVQPNLQNIPVRLAEGRKIRKAFLPDKADSVLLSSDYSQIELRVLAHISGDEHLITAFNDGADIHTATAMRVFGIEKPEDVTPNDRRNAKAVNFGVVYGISDFGLSNNLGITRKAAKTYIDTYFERYPDIKKYMEDIVRSAKDKGYVETLYHRRRNLPEINARNFSVRSFAERTAINSPIQGSAADILKVAMINLDRALTDGGYQAKMLLQVHDEIVLDVPRDELDTIKKLVKTTMEDAIALKVPLLVDENSGKTWYEAK